METAKVLRKGFPVSRLVERLGLIEDIQYWRRLHPGAVISDRPLQDVRDAGTASRAELQRIGDQLRKERYFQTAPLLHEDMVKTMIACIESVRAAGFPPMFALVYDAFYRAFAYFQSTLEGVLGPGFRLVPNFWVYYIDPSEEGKGFEPHRDAEYANTIGADGLPTVLTVWVALTDATPLNSCMYVVPAHRDPQYREAVSNLKVGGTRFALEDIRALPTQAGTISCWDQYLFHWGSRSSQHAEAPRISYAMYCQRADIPWVDEVNLDLRKPISFDVRMALICRSLYRYSHLSIREEAEAEPLLAFMEKHGVSRQRYAAPVSMDSSV